VVWLCTAGVPKSYLAKGLQREDGQELSTKGCPQKVPLPCAREVHRRD